MTWDAIFNYKDKRGNVIKEGDRFTIEDRNGSTRKEYFLQKGCFAERTASDHVTIYRPYNLDSMEKINDQTTN